MFVEEVSITSCNNASIYTLKFKKLYQVSQEMLPTKNNEREKVDNDCIRGSKSSPYHLSIVFDI